jgi:hypothetical protein
MPGIHVLASLEQKTWMAGTTPGHDEKGIIFKWFRNGRASGCEALHIRRDKTFVKEIRFT